MLYFALSADPYQHKCPNFEVVPNMTSQRRPRLGLIAFDDITLRARLSVQDHWPKNMQTGQIYW